MRSSNLFFSFLIFFLSVTQILSAQKSDSVPENKSKAFSFCNAAGFGYAERTGIFDDHLFYLNGNLCFGARARFSTRKYWRDIHYTPYSRYIEYKFINEFALLGGYRILNKGSFKLIVAAGPLIRLEKAREWPDKGSGSTPLIGFMLNRKKDDDVQAFGFTVSAEIAYIKSIKWSGVSLFVFSSFTKDVFVTGFTINLLLGRL